MKNIVKIAIPLAALAAAAALPVPYMVMGPLLDPVAKALRIKVDPRYSGGEVLAKFLDPLDDDRGEGGLSYPDLPAFQGRRVLDIIRYTVHRPVLNTAGGDSPDFWQLDVTFAEAADPLNAPLGFSLPVVHIYIDVDGKEGGSTATAQPDAELVAFDPEHPWDYMIHVDGFAGDGKGRIVSFDRAVDRPVQVYFVEAAKTMHVRADLDEPGLKRILDGRPTYHYVVAGAFDPYSSGKFMPVAGSAGPRNGGGARSILTPRIFDWVAPDGTDQARVLSSYEEKAGTYAVLVPLEAKESRGGEDRAGAEIKKRAAELLTEYREKLARETSGRPETDLRADVNALVKQGGGGMPLVEAYYRAQMFVQAELESRRVLGSSPDHALATLYLAMAIGGQSGRQSSPMKSLELVNRAIAQFDKASALCKTPDERLMLHLQRARYFAAIPEAFFRRSAAAADDFLKAAAIFRQRESTADHRRSMADCYISAAKAFAQAGKEDEAEIYFRKAAEFEDLTTEQIIALLERGIIPGAAVRPDPAGRI